jgi:alkylhydroperoxidase family enzyme
MALIPYPEPARLDPETRAAVDAFESEHGRPSLVRRMLAHYPPALAAIDRMYHPFMEQGQLDRRTKELVFVTASAARGCFY